MAGFRKLLAGLVAAQILVAGVVVAMRFDERNQMTVTAHFTRSVGLYPGSSVRVLGVKIGTVTDITPEGESVRVTMRLPRDTKVPADARAVIIPPSLVSDRYVQFVPPYTSGPLLEDGADIALGRTRTVAELDDILLSVDRLLVALGPKGANKDGALSELINVGADTLDGNGKKLNSALTDLSGAITTLAGSRDDLGGVITNLAEFTHTLATNDAQVRALTTDLASVAEQLAGERKALEQALKNLSIALGEVASLVRTNKGSLGRDIDTLAKVTQTVIANKQSLVEVLDTTPLVFANLVEVFNPERETLDIRNNNGQSEDPYSIFVCQLLAPILGFPAPDCVPTAPGSPTKLTTSARSGTRPPPVDADLTPFTVGGMLGRTP